MNVCVLVIYGPVLSSIEPHDVIFRFTGPALGIFLLLTGVDKKKVLLKKHAVSSWQSGIKS